MKSDISNIISVQGRLLDDEFCVRVKAITRSCICDSSLRTSWDLCESTRQLDMRFASILKRRCGTKLGMCHVAILHQH